MFSEEAVHFSSSAAILVYSFIYSRLLSRFNCRARRYTDWRRLRHILAALQTPAAYIRSSSSIYTYMHAHICITSAASSAVSRLTLRLRRAMRKSASFFGTAASGLDVRTDGVLRSRDVGWHYLGLLLLYRDSDLGMETALSNDCIGAVSKGVLIHCCGFHSVYAHTAPLW